MAVYGVLPNGDAARSYDAMNILAQAIKKVGELDMEAVRDAVWATENFNGATFTARFDENRRPVKDLVILRFQGRRPALSPPHQSRAAVNQRRRRKRPAS